MPVLFWLFLSGRRSKQDLLITNLQSQVDALGPEITAIEKRCGLRRPNQLSETIGIQYSVLSQIHIVVDLIARPHDLAPEQTTGPKARDKPWSTPNTAHRPNNSGCPRCHLPIVTCQPEHQPVCYDPGASNPPSTSHTPICPTTSTTS